MIFSGNCGPPPIDGPGDPGKIGSPGIGKGGIGYPKGSIITSGSG